MDAASRTKKAFALALAPFLSLAMVLSIGTIASGQTASQTTQAGDNDTARWQLAEMDRFLDSHPEIAEQLGRHPELIRNDEFVSNHPALQQFLQQHPGIREEFTENPHAFMGGEQRFEAREDQDARNQDVDRDRDRDRDRDLDRDRDRDQDRDRDVDRDRDRDRDVTRRELSTLDRFLDGHPEIAEQLRKNPSLISNREFVENHPALETFLQNHPGVSEEFTENPRGFMGQEERFDRREGLANVDRFFDSHPEISEQLRKNPSLIRNKEFVEQHPALQEFLKTHADVREQFRENPDAFMRREEQFDRHEDDRDRVADFHDFDQGVTFHGERRGEDMTSFGQFLGGHSAIAQQLSKDPSLANNREFLASHADLQQYLKAHPEVSQQLAKNPQGVIASVTPQANGTTATPKLQPKSKP